jgi:hypothetical protein
MSSPEGHQAIVLANVEGRIVVVVSLEAGLQAETAASVVADHYVALPVHPAEHGMTVEGHRSRICEPAPGGGLRYLARVHSLHPHCKPHQRK